MGQGREGGLGSASGGSAFGAAVAFCCCAAEMRHLFAVLILGLEMRRVQGERCRSHRRGSLWRHASGFAVAVITHLSLHLPRKRLLLLEAAQAAAWLLLRLLSAARGCEWKNRRLRW